MGKTKKSVRKFSGKLPKIIEQRKQKQKSYRRDKEKEKRFEKIAQKQIDDGVEDKFEDQTGAGEVSSTRPDVAKRSSKYETKETESSDIAYAKLLHELKPEREEEAEDEPSLDVEGEAEEQDLQDSKPAKAGDKRKRDSSKEVTAEKVKKWTSEALEGNQNSFKCLLKSFRSAVHTATDGLGDLEDELLEGPKGKSTASDFSVSSPAIVNAVLVACLKNMNSIFDKLLQMEPLDLTAAAIGHLPDRAKGYKKHHKFIRVFFRDLARLMPFLTDAQMISFTVTHLEALSRHLVASPNSAKKILKCLLGFFSHDNEGVRQRSFLCIRRIAISLPDPFLSLCLKGTYLTYLRHSRFYKRSNSRTIHFMRDAVAELYSAQPATSVELAQGYIRQLALLLKSFHAQKIPFEKLSSWEVINAARVWAALLSSNPDEAEFRSLHFPLSQVLMGLGEAAPIPTSVPLRFACVEALHTLAKANGPFVSTPCLILDVLCSKPMHRAYSSYTASDVPMDYSHVLTVSEHVIRDKSFKLALLRDGLYLLLEFFAIHAHSMSFPEISAPARIALKKMIQKDHQDARADSAIRTLVEKIEKHVQLVRDERTKVSFCPKDLDKVNAFESSLKAKFKLDFTLLLPKEGGPKSKPAMASSPSTLLQFYFSETTKRRQEAAKRESDSASGKIKDEEDEKLVKEESDDE